MLVTETERISGTNAGDLESGDVVDPSGVPAGVIDISQRRSEVKRTIAIRLPLEGRVRPVTPTFGPQRGRSRELPLCHRGRHKNG
jgi:hypothetical protein